jgi:hypothetical protein
MLFGSALESLAFELGWTNFPCTDNERVDGTFCHQRRVLLRGYLLLCLVSLFPEGLVDWAHPHVQSL